MPEVNIPASPTSPARPDGWNVSRVQDVARTMLGPHARVWHYEGQPVRIGLEHGAKKIVLGEGATYLDAVMAAFVEPVKKLERLRELEAEAARAPAAPLAVADGAE